MAYGDHCHSNYQRKIQLMRSQSYTIMAKAIFCLTTGLYRVIATHFHQMLRVYNQENSVSSGKMESLSANWALQIPGHPVNLQGHHSMFSNVGANSDCCHLCDTKWTSAQGTSQCQHQALLPCLLRCLSGRPRYSTAAGAVQVCRARPDSV